ncbi:DUF4259 domain-containing protein [Chitinophaga sp. CF418]|uniref:DUF4259 domain-containing protein n=1 Tax=Chitinophaga sp. CF418 TaxID=1855287 RepID=UPI000916E758|nr:DUF4259 domain-containing protein [Chitinophaga sp. CF418]SHN36826.1 protein of unknown function [Chitinophaga sp. CF418]
MGTWAVGSFGNDSAGDWVMDLMENPTFEFIRETLEESIENPNDGMSNENAIAAAETICILNGVIPSDYEEVRHNLEPAIAKLKERSIPADLKALALTAIEIIEKDSEIKELWEGDEEWTAEIRELKRRLTA